MKTFTSIAFAVSAIVLNINAAEAASITIGAMVRGSLTPMQLPVSDRPVTIVNGDFTILDAPGFTDIAGDGIDERTTWSFDFSDRPHLNLFSTSAQLSSALLTLTISPRDPFISTDTTGIDVNALVQTQPVPITLEPVNVPNLPNLPEVGQTGTITFDLLDFGFSQTALLEALNASASIPWFYQDDAIISGARLDLTIETVPEPLATLGTTLAFGLGVLFVKKRQC